MGKNMALELKEEWRHVEHWVFGIQEPNVLLCVWLSQTTLDNWICFTWGENGFNDSSNDLECGRGVLKFHGICSKKGCDVEESIFVFVLAISCTISFEVLDLFIYLFQHKNIVRQFFIVIF